MVCVLTTTTMKKPNLFNYKYVLLLKGIKECKVRKEIKNNNKTH